MRKKENTTFVTRDQVAADLRRRGGLIDAHTHLGADAAMYANGDYPYAMAAEDHGERMARSGLAAVVCFPFLYTSYYELAAFRRGVFRRDRKAGWSAPYEFENRRLCHEIYRAFPEYAGRLLPFAFFDPARRPAEQAACLRRLAGQYPLFGLKTATSYQHSHVTELLGRGSALLDFAAERDLPVTIHSAVLPGDPWANVFKIIEVVRQRPDVRFAIAHTCRFDRRALDAAHRLDNCFVDFSAFHIHCILARRNHPAVASRRNRFPADYRDPAAVMHAIAAAYPGTMLWGSDTPAHYWKSSFRNEHGQEIWLDLHCGPDDETAVLRALPRALQRQVARENTLRFLFGNQPSSRQTRREKENPA